MTDLRNKIADTLNARYKESAGHHVATADAILALLRDSVKPLEWEIVRPGLISADSSMYLISGSDGDDVQIFMGKGAWEPKDSVKAAKSAAPKVKPDSVPYTSRNIAVLRGAINIESGGYWQPTNDMLRRILSALDGTK